MTSARNRFEAMASSSSESVAEQLKRSPENADLHRQASLHASRLGDQKLAISYMEQAAALAPQSIEYRFQLACLLALAGRYEESLIRFDETVAASPTFSDAWYFKGIALQRLERDREALPMMRRAYALAPQNPKILRALAELEFRVGFPADALPLWDRLHSIEPHNLDNILKKGETLSRLGLVESAISTFDDGIRSTGESPQLWLALGQAHDEQGNRHCAERAFREALRLKPDWAFPMAGLLGLHRSNAPEDIVKRAGFLLDSSSMTDHDRSLLGYELGKVLDTLAEYEQAMARWNDANAARIRMTGPFDTDLLDRKTENIIETTLKASKRKVARPSSEDDRFVFIVGMPRSGTTLTEQIISSHPAAFGCGELPDIALISRHLALEMAPSGQWDHRNFGPHQLSDAVTRYVAAATRQAPAEAMRIVDKAPLNFWDLDLIGAMFPNARIVWCRRDPRDIAVSIYSENFALDERYATHLPWILYYTQAHTKLMRHWQEVLRIQIHELHYEKLACSIEDEARSLLDFIGLEWNDACLDFHKSIEGVQSPSRWQVKQPIHSRSIGRWRNYQDLQPSLSQFLAGDPAVGGADSESITAAGPATMRQPNMSAP